MTRYRRRQRDDEEQERARATSGRQAANAGRAAAEPAEPAGTLLDLQARAGNAAVLGLLAGAGPTVLREQVGAAGGGAGRDAKPADERGSAPGRMHVAELGTFDVESVALEPVRGHAGRTTRPPEDGQVHVVVRDGPLTPQLLQAVANGRTFGQVTIAIGYVLVLRDVLLADASVLGGQPDGPASVSLTLAYRRAEIRH